MRQGIRDAARTPQLDDDDFVSQCRTAAPAAARRARLKRDTIDDLAQETAVRTLRALAAMAMDERDRPIGAGLRGFIVEVASNVAHELARAERRERRRLRPIDTAAPDSLRARVVPVAPPRDRATCLSGDEPWLTEPDRELVRRVHAGASLDGISASFGRSRGSVMRRLVVLLRAAAAADPAAVVTTAAESAARRNGGRGRANEALRLAADTFAPGTRTVLERRARGDTPAQIAAALGLSCATVRKRLSRAAPSSSQSHADDGPSLNAEPHGASAPCLQVGSNA